MNTLASRPPPRPRGRPRGFEDHAALEAAMKAFWATGFDGASIDVLCRAMNMPRASLYRAFDGKDGLFLATVGHYVDTRIAPVAAALGPKGSLAEDLTGFFDQVIRLATADPQTPGCLISCVLADAAGSNPVFRKELDHRFSGLEARIADRLHHAGWPQNGAVPAAAAASLAAAAARGIMLRARSGQTPGDLAPIGAAAVAALVRLSA